MRSSALRQPLQPLRCWRGGAHTASRSSGTSTPAPLSRAPATAVGDQLTTEVWPTHSLPYLELSGTRPSIEGYDVVRAEPGQRMSATAAARHEALLLPVPAGILRVMQHIGDVVCSKVAAGKLRPVRGDGRLSAGPVDMEAFLREQDEEVRELC